MTTLKSEDYSKTIQFSLSDNIREVARDVNIIEMPFVVCSNKKDAEYIQTKMGEYLGELTRKVIKDN